MSAESEDVPTGPSGDTATVRTARVLGYAGLAPFVGLSLWLYSIPSDHEWRTSTILFLVAYGAVILSFLGGVRWGVGLGQPDSGALSVALSIVAPLIAWCAVALPAPYAFVVLAVAFAAQGAWDTLAVHNEKAPEWYGRLRMTLTLIVVPTMILAFIATS